MQAYIGSWNSIRRDISLSTPLKDGEIQRQENNGRLGR